MGRPARLTPIAPCAVALLALAPRASAQPAPCADRPVTLEIDRAIEERRRGREEAGFRRLQGLWQRCPSPRTLAQLALAEHGLGRFLDAYVHLRDALAAQSDPWIASREAPLRSVLGEVAMRIARVAPSCSVPGAVLRVDGAEVGALPLATPWAFAGPTATLEVSAPGHITARRTVTVPEGTVWREVIALAPEAPAVAIAPPVVAPPPASEASPVRRAVAWGAVGVGAAFGAVAVWQAVSWSSQADESLDARVTQPGDLGAWARFQRDFNPGGRMTSSAVCDLASAARTPDALGAASLCADNARAAGLALGFGVAGVALAVTGVVLLVTGRPGATEAPREPAVQVGAWLGGGVGGARVTGNF